MAVGFPVKEMRKSTDSFILNGKKINLSQLLDKEYPLPVTSDFELNTLTFIDNWISGQHQFSIKTSGSSGPPKTMTFSREQMIASARRTIDYLHLKPGDSILACLNPYYIAGMMVIVRAFEGNMRLIIETPQSNPLKALSDNPIDIVSMTPNQADMALTESFSQLRTIKKILIGGAAIHPDLEERLQTLPSQVFHTYAMTETLSHVAMRLLNKKKSDKIYHALPGVSFSQDNRKCLVIEDHTLGIEKLVTNDIVELIDKRSFEWIGRYDNVINTGGIKIQMEAIEREIMEILKDLGYSDKFCITSMPDPKLSNKLILLLEAENNRVNDEKVLLESLKNKLPKFHVPRQITFVPKIIYTATGKIDRIGNTDRYLN